MYAERIEPAVVVVAVVIVVAAAAKNRVFAIFKLWCDSKT